MILRQSSVTKKILIIASLILFIMTSCRELINPVDPESALYIGKPSVDIDGDGIGQYEDVDEINLISPENGATVTEFPLVLETYKFNPEKVQKYWIQISTSSSDFENMMIFSIDDYPSNECEIPRATFQRRIVCYWRAKAFDGKKWSDKWSEIWGFVPDLLDITGSMLDDNNSYVDVSFSKGVYATGGGTGGLEVSDFNIIFGQNGGGATDASISGLTTQNWEALAGGETIIRLHLSISGTPTGVETVEITPAGETSIYDAAGNVIAASATTEQLVLNTPATGVWDASKWDQALWGN